MSKCAAMIPADQEEFVDCGLPATRMILVVANLTGPSPYPVMVCNGCFETVLASYQEDPDQDVIEIREL